MKLIKSEVKVNVGSTSEPKYVIQPVEYNVFVGPENKEDVSWVPQFKTEILEFLESSTNEQLLNFLNQVNMGIGFYARQPVATRIRATNVSPAKAIEKLSKEIFEQRAKVGRPITMEAAIAKAKADFAD